MWFHADEHLKLKEAEATDPTQLIQDTIPGEQENLEGGESLK